MTGSIDVAGAELLLLTIEEVPLGSTVYVCDPETSVPAEDGDGKLPPLIKMIGGIPIGTKLYPVDQIRQNAAGTVTASGFTTANAGVFFTPVEIYSPDDAPELTVFAVFVQGRRLRYEKWNRGEDWWYNAKLYKGEDGRLVSVGYSPEHWLREMPLPADAQLVATCEVGKGTLPRHPSW